MKDHSISPVEIAIFGPGYGESIALRLGTRWTIVDSCMFRGEKVPAPLSYLRSRGFNPATDVDWVVATHWHDDHVRGLGRMFAECGVARFGCPNALQNDAFRSLLAHYRLPTQLQSTGVDEFNEVFRELKRRGATPAWIGEARVLVESSICSDIPVRIDAASPSDEAFQKALADFAQRLPVAPANGVAPIRRVTPIQPNHSAIVLHATIGEMAVLLGSDLETVPSSGDGWNRVVGFLGGKTKARIIKIPHHGSRTAHHEGMWEDLAAPDPIAILTPFVRGRVRLPARRDADRILARTPRAYITCSPARLEQRLTDKTVRKIVEPISLSPFIAQTSRRGVIVLTCDPGPDLRNWTVNLSGEAVALSTTLDRLAVAAA